MEFGTPTKPQGSGCNHEEFICKQCGFCVHCQTNNDDTPRRKKARINYFESLNQAQNKQILDDPVASIREFLSIDPNFGRGMPGSNDRSTKPISELDSIAVGRMTTFAATVFEKICKMIFPYNGDALTRLVIAKLDASIPVYKNDTLAKNMKASIDALPMMNLQRDVLLAPISVSYSNAELKNIFEVGRKKAAKSRNNFKLIQNKQPLKPPTETLQRYQQQTVKVAVTFIMSCFNVHQISRGNRIIMIDDVEEHFPILVRRKIVKNILNDYIDHFPNKENRIGATSFQKIVRSITRKDQHSKKAVDYVSGILLYDNFTIIRQIVDYVENHNTLSTLVNSMEAFIMSKFESHIGSCHVTNPNFAFNLGVNEQCTCNTCELPFRVMQYLKTQVQECHHRMLNDCNDKINLYLGHRVRVHVQRVNIKEIMDNLKYSEAMIIMDFKMKFEAMYYREKTVDFYGKKGIMWHSSQVYTRYSDQDQKTHGNLEDFCITNYDHIATSGSKQDWMVVLSCFESVVIAIKQTMPHVKALNVQSDNAKCYCSGFLLVGMIQVATHHGFKLPHFIHTGVQDGKGPVDAHLGTASAHVKRYCNEGHNVINPADLVKALQHNGGVNNSYAYLISINRKHMSKFFWDNKDWMKENKINNSNDMQYNHDTKEMTIFEYSGFGAGKTFVIDFEDDEQKCTATSLNEDTKGDIKDLDEDEDNEDEDEGNDESSESSLEDDNESDDTEGILYDENNSDGSNLESEDEENEDEEDFEYYDSMERIAEGEITHFIVYGSNSFTSKMRKKMFQKRRIYLIYLETMTMMMILNQLARYARGCFKHTKNYNNMYVMD